MEEVAMLLQVVEKCAGHSGKLNAIANEAMARLLEVNEECRQHGMERAEKAKAEENERLKAEAEARAAQEAADAEEIAVADEDARPKAIPADKLSQADAGRRL